MLDIHRLCVSPQTKIRHAIEVLNDTGRQIILVVDNENKLKGVFTDGDLRRAVIDGKSLDDSITGLFNTSPAFSWLEDGRQVAVEKMQRLGIDQLPILDRDMRVVGLESINPGRIGVKTPYRVFILAGGLGTRLRPYTDNRPKALVPIGGKPILEHILEKFINQGFTSFIFAVNHMSEMIEGYFQDGRRWNVSISYVYEQRRMGTAGALSLLEVENAEPIIVTNCDVLTSANYQAILEDHIKSDNSLTIGAREFSYRVPYGVIHAQGGTFKSIEEKPEVKWKINAGVYVLSIDAVKTIPEDEYTDMTTVIENLKSTGAKIGVHTIDAFWIDIGQPHELERSRALNDEI